MEFLTQYGYSGYKAHFWIYSYLGTIAIVFSKVSRLAYPTVTEIVEVIKEKIVPVTIERTVTIEKEIPPVRSKRNHEIIYVLRRADGILKFGRTNNLKKRIVSHQIDYRSKFDIAASWVVTSPFAYEQLALRMTNEFSYFEAGRKELRKMTQKELNDFIVSFTNKVQREYNQ
jgi:predicted GIY-YIG superfamily endonuclease